MNLFWLVAVFLLPILLGGRLASPYHSFRGTLGWLAAGCVTGLTLFTAITFLTCWGFGQISPISVLSGLALFSAVVYGFRRYVPAARIYRSAPIFPGEEFVDRLISRVLVVFLGVLVIACLRRTLFVNAEGYFIGFANTLGDLPFHLHLASSFLFSDNFPPLDPIFSGTPLRYPFLCDFYSSLLWFATGDVETAFELPGIVLGLSLVVMLYKWVRELTGSRLSGAISGVLFFFNGGLGFIHWFSDISQKNYSDSFFPKSYSHLEKLGFQFANVIDTLLIPQRALQFAFPLFILILSLVVDGAEGRRKEKFLFAALLAAPLPFFHSHAVIALTVLSAGIFCFYPSIFWLYLMIPLGVCWLPQVMYLAQIIGNKVPSSQKFFRFDFGWESEGVGVILFWLKNAGPYLLLTIWGLIAYRKEKRIAVILASTGLLLFFLGNTILFAPWSWDNIKILIFWYLAGIPLVAYVLTRIWEQGSWYKPLAIVLLLSLTLSGALDVLHDFVGVKKDKYGLFHKWDVRIAEWIRENTPRDAVFLVAPTYNQPLVLTGRPMVMGYPGHIWSHGIDGTARTAAINSMSQGGEKALELMKKYHVSYILYGARERDQNFSREFLDKKVGQYHAAYNFIIYKVPEN